MDWLGLSGLLGWRCLGVISGLTIWFDRTAMVIGEDFA